MTASFSRRILHPELDGWMDGWMDGWLDGWLVGWLDGWLVNVKRREHVTNDLQEKVVPVL
jgi:hypothetical protein